MTPVKIVERRIDDLIQDKAEFEMQKSRAKYANGRWVLRAKITATNKQIAFNKELLKELRDGIR